MTTYEIRTTGGGMPASGMTVLGDGHHINDVIIDIVLGVIGAVVVSYLIILLGAAQVTSFNLFSLLVAVVGAVVVLLIYHAFISRRTL